ncbi:unnamed protein product, partial [Scytosiphon promiscuus]
MFSTGAGRAIEVSAEALARVQGMFNQEAEAGHERADAGDAPALEAAAVSFRRGEDQEVGDPFVREEGQRERGGSAVAATTAASMFSTGSGRRVEVSAEALARAQKMFGEAEAASPSTDERDIHRTSLPSFGGRAIGGGSGASSAFSTGRGKAVQVSPAALSHARNRYGAAGGDGPEQSPLTAGN